MTWTYSGDPDSTALDAIRFLIGDTDTNDQLLSNEEISWVNSEASGSSTATTALYDAAMRCCLTIASKLAREADTISDKDIDEENSDIFRSWFSSGQFENVRDGGRSQTIRGIHYFGPGAD
mgnify:CR=1 FL=1